jgi:hypothetical protein
MGAFVEACLENLEFRPDNEEKEKRHHTYTST